MVNQIISWFCRLMRRSFRKWWKWDLTGINWLNLLGTGYKMRFVPLILSFYICQIIPYYHPYISGYCGILFVIGQPISCFQWLSWSWVSRDHGGFILPLIVFNISLVICECLSLFSKSHLVHLIIQKRRHSSDICVYCMSVCAMSICFNVWHLCIMWVQARRMGRDSRIFGTWELQLKVALEMWEKGEGRGGIQL